MRNKVKSTRGVAAAAGRPVIYVLISCTRITSSCTRCKDFECARLVNCQRVAFEVYRNSPSRAPKGDQ